MIAFIDDHREAHGVEPICKVLQIAPSTYYADVPPYLNERRQLRLYGPDDLFFLKPTEARYWTATVGLNDADVILADHWLSGRDAASYA